MWYIYSSLTSSLLLFTHLPWSFQLSHTLTILELTCTLTVQKFFLNSPCAPGLGVGVESRAGGSISEIRPVAVGKPWTNHCPKVESYKTKHCHSGMFVTLGKSCTLLCSPSGVSKLFLQGSDSKWWCLMGRAASQVLNFTPTAQKQPLLMHKWMAWLCPNKTLN